MKILFVTSEANPYAASGGLGDVMGALPSALAADPDTEVSVILPLYNTVSEAHRASFERVADISFNLSWRKTGASIFKTEKDGATYYFVENHRYFDRFRLYGEYDDGERFAFFSAAVVEFMLQTDVVPDVLHANDWQSALSVIYLKTRYKSAEKLSGIKTVFTIHNIEYQGKYGMDALGDIFGIDDEHRGYLEHDGCINLLKGAVEYADRVTTVSPNYANELKYPFFAFGLSEIIKSAEHKLFGVINGIDYEYFSPDRGGDIDFPYNKITRKKGKAKNKLALLTELGLSEYADRPLIVMITRLAKGKGVDLMLHIIEELLEKKVTVIILGTGEKEYELAFTALESRYPNIRALIKFDRVISKKLYASADIFLMPSKSEPCGLAQMIACSYGTVPIVRAVGGLYDSIKSYPATDSNGFTFDNYNAHDFLFKINEALELYKDDAAWDKLTLRAIKSDFTWGKSAAKYIEIYRNLLI